MQRKLLLLLLTAGISISVNAQFSRYIIQFRDKGSNPFSITNPGQYLSQRAIERRARYNIPVDSSDLPVTPAYIDSIRLSGNVTILNISKWLNQVAIRTTDAAALAKINSFPFVSGAFAAGSRLAPGIEMPARKQQDSTADNLEPFVPSGENITGYYDYGKSNGQVKIHQGDFLHNHGFRGEGMHMAIMDAGFFHYESLPTFDSMRHNNQVLGTWDFVANETSVDEDHSHGMQCLSTIAANIPGVFVGTAPNTSFYLYRTEDVSSEYPIEEQNFAAAAERADSLGVDICSVSLGYYDFSNPVFNYSYADMDGNTTISARAADYAAKKGMLMVVAAGNEGNNSWHYLITPSDADSVLSVGAVDTLGSVASFSSYGPSSDGQVKPAVAAVGAFAIVANTGTGLPAYGFGTSFACPNMAGIATCLWQAFPEISNMGIIQTLQTAANNTFTPNDRTGYGIPDAKKAFVMLQQQRYRGQASISNCKTNLQFSVKTDATMSIEIERKLDSETAYTTHTSLQDFQVFGEHDFVFEDDLSFLPAGLIKYRLKMNIAADTSYYLDSIVVDHLQACNNFDANSIRISPNPVQETLTVSSTRISAADMTIIIQNALGQKVYAEQFHQKPGTQLMQVNMGRFGRGVYFISVYADGKKQETKKVVRD